MVSSVASKQGPDDNRDLWAINRRSEDLESGAVEASIGEGDIPINEIHSGGTTEEVRRIYRSARSVRKPRQ